MIPDFPVDIAPGQYLVQFRLRHHFGGTITPRLGDHEGEPVKGEGDHAQVLEYRSGPQRLDFLTSAGFVGRISGVSVREVQS